MYFDTTDYETLIQSFYRTMKRNAKFAGVRLSGDKWTLAEMVGHLIDSASNNHQRFIRLQLEKKVFFPAYDAEEWKRVSQVSAFDFPDLAALWKQYNLFLLHVIRMIDEKSASNCWQIGTERKTLEFLVKDYFVHLQWHLELYNDRIAEIKEFV